MNELMVGILGTVGGSALTAVLFALKSWIRKRVKISGPAEETLDEQARQLAIQRALVLMLVGLAKPQLLALRGILEALREKMNGGFERPHESIRKALDDYDETMKKIVSGECAEKKTP